MLTSGKKTTRKSGSHRPYYLNGLTGNGQVLVIAPLIGLLALDELEYTKFAQEVMNANPGIDDYTVAEVWNRILENLFHNPMKSTKQKKRKEATQ